MFVVNTLAWCLISITLSSGIHGESAALGFITEVKKETIVVDFSDYADKMSYKGEYSNKEVLHQSCIDMEFLTREE